MPTATKVRKRAQPERISPHPELAHQFRPCSLQRVSEDNGDEVEAAVLRGISGESAQVAPKVAESLQSAASKRERKERAAASYQDPDDYPTSKFDPSKAKAPLQTYRQSNAKKRKIPRWIRAFFRDERGVHEQSARVFEQVISSNEQVRKDLDKLFKKTSKIERKLQWFEEMIDETRMDTTEFKSELTYELQSIQTEIQGDVSIQLSEIELASDQLFERIDMLHDSIEEQDGRKTDERGALGQ